MTEQKNPPIARRTTQVIGALAFLMLAGAVLLALFNQELYTQQVESEFGYVLVIFGINALISTVLALLILSRHPGHGVGRLLLAIGFIFSWFAISFIVGGLYGNELLAVPALIRPFVGVGFLLYLLPLMLTFGLVPLYFPDGRLPSPRWRPVLVVVWIGIIGQTVLQGLLDLQEEIPGLPAPPADSFVAGLFELILIAGILGSLASLVVRYIHSRGDERTRMKWLVYTAVMSISIVLLMSTILDGDSRILSILSSGVPAYLTIAIGIAILRHRLFDIDIVIRRTLSYAVLTAILALTYFGGVVLLQNVFGGLAGDRNSPLITVLSTLVIAALFNPLRTRIQDFIDRRFYRARYDAELTLAHFASTVRDEVDPQALSSAILGVVDETMQPERASLWLKTDRRRPPV